MAANIHASCVVLGGGAFDVPEGTGVLLLGPSGAGKSDLALRLIAAGAALVADDRTDLSVRDGALIATPPVRLAGLMEVRNLGIMPLPYRSEAQVKLVLELVPGIALARLPDLGRWAPPEGLELLESAWPPLVRLDPFEGSAAAKVALAAAACARGSFGAAITPP